jgi:Fibronectin type III domain
MKATLWTSASLLAIALLLMPATAGGKAGGAAPMRLASSDLFIEINATDGDAGLQLHLDGEKWRNMRIVNPRGQTILDISGSSTLRGYGLTGLTFESAEPPFRQFPFSRFKARFPTGTYRFSGTTVGGRRLVGSDRLTHRIPQKPVITAPAEDARVSTRGLVVRWNKVTRPRGIRIVHYQVIVTQQEPQRVLDLTMPPSATSVSIPPEFLQPGKEYALEVLAREASGNQVITEIAFRTT